MSVDGMVRSFFAEWRHRDIQSQMLKRATDTDLATLLLVTSDIQAIILAEYDRRGHKKEAS